MSKGNVKKYTKNKGYESISRNMVQDIENLSLQAIGLLSHLISLPEDFSIYKTVLYRRFNKNGRRSVVNAWNELVKNNYIIQFKKRTDSGKWEYLYYFSQEKFGENDISEIEKSEGTKRWQVESEKKNDNQPLYILNSGQTVNGKRSVYISNNKDLLLNKDIDKDIDTKDTKKTEIKNTSVNKSSKNDYKRKSFYQNSEKIPPRLGEMFEAFYGDNINQAKKVYKKVLIAKKKAEKETNTVIHFEDNQHLLDLIINTLSRSIRKIEKDNIKNPSGYIYKSVLNTLINEINAITRREKHENSDIYFDWIENE